MLVVVDHRENHEALVGSFESPRVWNLGCVRSHHKWAEHRDQNFLGFCVEVDYHFHSSVINKNYQY